MNIRFPKKKSEIIYHLNDSLIKNSLFIMLTAISNAGFGFIFWMLGAKLYSPDDVGMATALISSVGLIILLSRFGMESSIISFFPTADKRNVFNTSIIITTSFAVLFGVIFILGIDIFSAKLYLLKSPLNALFFLIVLSANSVAMLTAISFIAIRKSTFQFLQSIVVGSRVLFLIPFISFGAMGIFVGFGISFLFASFVALILLVRLDISPKFVIDRHFLSETFKFSTGNYFAGFFITAPNTILPIIILNYLGSKEVAYYYIVYAIATLLFIIPNAISMSLFVEGSHGKALKSVVIKSLLMNFIFLSPFVLIIYFFAGPILSLVGTDYAVYGVELLRLMVLASFFVCINYVYYSIKRIQRDTKGLILVSSLNFVLLIGLGYVFMLRSGITGIGYAWIISNVAGNIIAVMMTLKDMD